MARKEKKYHFIYKTTNILSGRYYIGMHSTDNLEDGYLGSGNRLRLAIRKHGKDNFVREILEYCDSRVELRSREAEIVNLNEISKVDCMNLVVGGEGGESAGRLGNLAFIKKLKEDEAFHKQRIQLCSRNMIENHKNGKIKSGKDVFDWTGKKHSEETKKLMCDQRKGSGEGKTNSQFGTCWITKDGLNKKIKKEDLSQFELEGWVKGKTTKIFGSKVGNSKLSKLDVVEIKGLLLDGKLSQAKIGKLFGVSGGTIYKIKSGENWGWLSI